ncbi:MAG TPA: phosphoribosylaminoimidazolesuccinocarboxamide synthase [Candidatus Limnocylindrales bacterium]|jgi:phosphoribosylaminoimidazole-succinocarboxamide synthase
MLLAEHFVRSGKVRDLYDLPDGRMLLVASDRLSAFDVVLPTEIPDKGRVLTGLSRFWFAETAGIVPNHLLSTDVASLPKAFAEHATELRGRMMIGRTANVLPIEVIVRGYLAGSGWKEYRESGAVCGIALPDELREGDRLPAPIFTPSTKAPQGEHDQNVPFSALVVVAGEETAEAVRAAALALYGHAAAITERAGILLADTKFEFGLAEVDGETRLLLIDEALTPDSSRFWDAAAYRPGGPQPSFDKQYVRDWLEAQPWDKTAPGPALPDDIVEGTRARYIEAYERITGASFERYLQEDVIAP